MSAVQWTVLSLITPFVIFIIARLIFAAWFLSKRQFEERKNHHE